MKKLAMVMAAMAMASARGSQGLACSSSLHLPCSSSFPLFLSSLHPSFAFDPQNCHACLKDSSMPTRPHGVALSLAFAPPCRLSRRANELAAMTRRAKRTGKGLVGTRASWLRDMMETGFFLRIKMEEVVDVKVEKRLPDKADKTLCACGEKQTLLSPFLFSVPFVSPLLHSFHFLTSQRLSGSGRTYYRCCRDHHNCAGAPEDPVMLGFVVDLIRARYSAFAYRLPSFIIRTTSRKSKEWTVNQKKWMKELLDFMDS
eukprot:157928-Hanusia_phi.AAC.1